MSQTQTRARPLAADPFHDSLPAPQGPGSDMLPAITPRVGGAATDQALAAFVTAQRVAVKRDLGGVLREAQTLGAAAGPAFFYRIPYKRKNKQTGEVTTEWVEGPSIDCAMEIAALYGNCWIGATVREETQSHWIFQARFVDLEKGVTIVREFQQRKGQDTGMRDGDRQRDIVFQIGQSKAIRNVVVAAIPRAVDVAYEAAKNSLVGKIEKNPGQFLERLLAWLEQLGVAVKRVERALGRASNAWTVADMARTYADAKAIKDGMASADDIWPLPSADSEPASAPAAAEPTRSETAMADAGGEDDGQEDAGEPPAQPEQKQPEPPPAEKPRQRAKPAAEPPPADPAPPAGPAPSLNFGE